MIVRFIYPRVPIIRTHNNVHVKNHFRIAFYQIWSWEG
jgi:hypothetical protein